MCLIEYNYPPKEGWIVVLYTEMQSVEVNRCSPTLRRIVVQYLPNQLDKNEKKVTFCKFKTSLSWNLFALYKHFGDFVKRIFTICGKFSMKIIFQLTLTSQSVLLSWYLFVRLLYLSLKFRLFQKCLERKRHLGSGRKTMNSKGYSELRGANQHARTLQFTDLVNTKIQFSAFRWIL